MGGEVGSESFANLTVRRVRFAGQLSHEVLAQDRVIGETATVDRHGRQAQAHDVGEQSPPVLTDEFGSEGLVDNIGDGRDEEEASLLTGQASECLVVNVGGEESEDVRSVRLLRPGVDSARHHPTAGVRDQITGEATRLAR